MEDKKREKYLQARYRRELERYLNRVVSFAMKNDFARGDYDEIVEKVDKKLESVEKVRLNSEYFESLEGFVQKCRDMKVSGMSEDEISSRIVHEANRIRKLRRKKSYNRKEKRREAEDDFG